MKLLAVSALHFAPLFAQAIVKYDYAIMGSDGASLEDCVWSLFNEHDLHAYAIVSSKPHGKTTVCFNKNGSGCKPGLVGWKHVLCIQRYDVYYRADQAPTTSNQWVNRFGTCHYKPYSDNAAGSINNYDSCRCSEVGEPDDC